MQIDIYSPSQVAANSQPTPDIVVVIDVLRATSTAVVLGERASEGILLVPRPEMLPSLVGNPKDYLVFSELTSDGFERVDNSPSRAEVVKLDGRTPVLVTTNGTIATEIASAHGTLVILASFLNISAVAKTILSSLPSRVMIVPAGKVSNDSRCFEDDQCALALELLLRGKDVDLRALADECRDAPLIIQRLLDEDGLLVDVDYVLRPDVSDVVLWVKPENTDVFRISAER